MDGSDPDISFDERGVCNHCSDCDRLLLTVENSRSKEHVAKLVTGIRQASKGSRYDCIIGLSGGVDSSYLAYRAKDLGLKPLVIHLDNGWDSELAVKNIENLVRKLELDLHTHVVDWPEFRDVQLAFFEADVIDIEMITDHAITALAFEQAAARGVKHILTGVNTVTESILPSAWVHPKTDLRNLKAIHKSHGKLPMKTLPTASTLKIRYLSQIRGIRTTNLLDSLDYNKQEAMRLLEEHVGWTNYGGKHHESVFTRFYQQYILPVKFGVDKRKAHLSSLICAGQVTREEALAQLEEPPYNPERVEDDITYVIKKLGMSRERFDAYMKAPPRSHYEYPSDQKYLKALSRIKKTLRLSGGYRTADSVRR